MSLFLLCSLILHVYSKTYDNNIIITQLSSSDRCPFHLDNVYSSQQIKISLDDNYSIISPRQTDSLINVHDNIFYNEAMYLIHSYPDANKIDTNIKTPFYFVNDTSTKRLRMGRHFDDENYSLLHYLYKSKQIKYKSFTLTQLHLLRRAQTIEIKHLIPNTNRCSIGVGNNVLQINKKAYFDLDKDLYEWLRDEVFYDLFLSRMCKEYKMNYGNRETINSRFSCLG